MSSYYVANMLEHNHLESIKLKHCRLFGHFFQLLTHIFTVIFSGYFIYLNYLYIEQDNIYDFPSLPLMFKLLVLSPSLIIMTLGLEVVILNKRQKLLFGPSRLFLGFHCIIEIFSMIYCITAYHGPTRCIELKFSSDPYHCQRVLKNFHNGTSENHNYVQYGMLTIIFIIAVSQTLSKIIIMMICYKNRKDDNGPEVEEHKGYNYSPLLLMPIYKPHQHV